MKNEIEKILTMVQEGKIDAEKGSELIEVLKEKEEEETTFRMDETSTKGKLLKIRVHSEDGDQVSINLPIKIIKLLTKMGANIPESEKYLKNVDVNILLEAIDNDIVGDIIDVKSDDGDIVKISIE
ncbi:SHOCT-like domain-containing protein [Fervidibacillus halotolerans]|uniref:YvlB/LiaX N-terminal domain-containing protein n=1 Tax=Fervidibacillus halotolerans TaxID=2980027 RepID=A0A9E8RZ27_9BACI|nr:hypothetical protein [Fervidibacillus halotolerans]WAA12873.1 hypothetical protein OE105_01625 [Fervidibacillus halotolerans]